MSSFLVGVKKSQSLSNAKTSLLYGTTGSYNFQTSIPVIFCATNMRAHHFPRPRDESFRSSNVKIDLPKSLFFPLVRKVHIYYSARCLASNRLRIIKLLSDEQGHLTEDNYNSQMKKAKIFVICV